MKRTLYTIFLLTIISFYLSSNLGAFINAKSFAKNDVIVLFTDRTLYISGESIQFGAHVSNEAGDISKILYAELIDPLGNRINSGKYIIEEKKSFGNLLIPNDILSGTYYIKSYTRWMRNFSVEEYFFLPIKIINPYRNEVLSVGITSGNGNRAEVEGYEELSAKVFVISNDSEYAKRKPVSFSIDLKSIDQSLQWACISIAPYSTFSGNKFIKPITFNGLNNSAFYLPETKGFILSGKVENSEDKTPMLFTLVNISILGKHSDFIATRTDSSGNFSIQLPTIYGSSELYIGIENKGNVKVKIDSDYCTRNINLPLLPFELSENERDVSTKLVRNIDVENVFSEGLKKSYQLDTLKKPNGITFYGTPENTFYFDKYVNLLSIEEYFFELIPNVSIRQQQRQRFFKIHGNYAELSIFKPLVLLDMIAIHDTDKLLSIQPTLLHKIEIVAKPYYKGDLIYGGIISFFSKKGDIAGIDLPPSDMFLELDFLSSSIDRTNNLENFSENLPDTRNSILWVDNLDISSSRLAIDFQTPDTPGDYIIVFRGLTQTGEVIYSTKTITIN
jgi:hypothetical protein